MFSDSLMSLSNRSRFDELISDWLGGLICNFLSEGIMGTENKDWYLHFKFQGL